MGELQSQAFQRAASALCRTTVRSVECPETILIHHTEHVHARPLVDQIARSYLSGAGLRVVDCRELLELATESGEAAAGEAIATARAFVDEAVDLQAHLLVSAGGGAEAVFLHALRASLVRRRPVVVVTIGSAGLPESLAPTARAAGVLCLSRIQDWILENSMSAPAADAPAPVGRGEVGAQAIEKSIGDLGEASLEEEWVEIRNGSRVTRVRKPKRARREPVQNDTVSGSPGPALEMTPAAAGATTSPSQSDMPPLVRTDPDLAARRLEQIERIRRRAAEG